MLRVGRFVRRSVRRNVTRTYFKYFLMDRLRNHTQPVVEGMDPVRPVACEDRRRRETLATPSTASRWRDIVETPSSQS